jgi:hypothetical protein
MVDILGGIFEACSDVLPLQIRVVGEDLIFARPGSEHLENVFDTDPHVADAWSPAAFSRINGNSRL